MRSRGGNGPFIRNGRVETTKAISLMEGDTAAGEDDTGVRHPYEPSRGVRGIPDKDAFTGRGSSLRTGRTGDVHKGWTAKGAQVGEVRSGAGEEAKRNVIDASTKGAIVQMDSHSHSKFPEVRAEACIIKHAPGPCGEGVPRSLD
jgi:hypothetical protein